MEKVKEYRQSLDLYLHKENTFTEFLGKIEKTTKISRLNLFLGFVCSIVIYLIFGYGGNFLTNVIGFIFPAYFSVKAIESTEKSDDTKWLIYWVVYAVFCLVESATDIFLSWVPLYALFKCIFLVYLMVPTKWNGSIYIYQSFILPYMLKNQQKIDEILKTGKTATKEIVDTVIEYGETNLKERVMDDLNKED